MAEQWYCQIGAQQYGPVDFVTLQSWAHDGRIHADDLVWTEGMANWQPAKTIPNLLDSVASPGVPYGPNAVGAGAAVHVGGYQVQRWSQPHRGTSILVYGILGLVCCIIFAIMGWSMGSSDLAAMREGRMDPSGEGLTRAGMILGIIGTILGVIGIIFGVIGALVG